MKVEELKQKQEQLEFDKIKFNSEEASKAKELELDLNKFELEKQRFILEREKFETEKSKLAFELLRLRNETIQNTLDIVQTMNAIKNDISFESVCSYETATARFIGRELDVHEENIYAAAAMSVTRLLQSLSMDSVLQPEKIKSPKN